MYSKNIDELKDKLYEELDEIARKDELDAGDLEIIHKLTDTIKNIDKICLMGMEGGEYSQDGYSSRYDDGGSYARRGSHYVRGHYSMNNGSSYDDEMSYARGGRRTTRTRGYSRDDGKHKLMEKLGMMMKGATPEQREVLERCMDDLESM